MREALQDQAPRKHRLGLLYFSGTGGTKVTAELLGELLATEFAVSVKSIQESDADLAVANSDLTIFLYPTYFLRPAPSMSEFISRLGPYFPTRPAYIITTYELYSENSIRACALAMKERGLEHIGSRALRAPGSDVTCLVPSRLSPWLYRFERKLPVKMLGILAEIRLIAGRSSFQGYIPRKKWYTPFAQLLQILALNGFESWKDRYRVLSDRCTLCGSCVAMCHRSAWKISESKLIHLHEKCELCTRCIHRCPSRAIVLIESLKNNARLDAHLYASLKDDTKQRLAELCPPKSY